MSRIIAPPKPDPLSAASLPEACAKAGMVGYKARSASRGKLLLGTGPGARPALLLGGEVTALVPLCGARDLWAKPSPMFRATSETYGRAYWTNERGLFDEVNVSHAQSDVLVYPSDGGSQAPINATRVEECLKLIGSQLALAYPQVSTPDGNVYTAALTQTAFNWPVSPLRLPSPQAPCPPEGARDPWPASLFQAQIQLHVNPRAASSQNTIEQTVRWNAMDGTRTGDYRVNVYACLVGKPGGKLSIPFRIRARTVVEDARTVYPNGSINNWKVNLCQIRMAVWCVPIDGAWANTWPSPANIPDDLLTDWGQGGQLHTTTWLAKPLVQFPEAVDASGTWGAWQYGLLEAEIPESRLLAIGLLDDSTIRSDTVRYVLGLPDRMYPDAGAFYDQTNSRWDVTEMVETFLDLTREAELQIDFANAHPTD